MIYNIFYRQWVFHLKHLISQNNNAVWISKILKVFRLWHVNCTYQFLYPCMFLRIIFKLRPTCHPNIQSIQMYLQLKWFIKAIKCPLIDSGRRSSDSYDKVVPVNNEYILNII
jgi:hypothetical protein